MLSNAAGMVLIAVAVALQFLPLYDERIAPWTARHPLLGIVRSRLFQLGAGFALMASGIELIL